MPDKTRRMGQWENGKRMKWIDGEDHVSLKPANWDEYVQPTLDEQQQE